MKVELIFYCPVVCTHPLSYYTGYSVSFINNSVKYYFTNSVAVVMAGYDVVKILYSRKEVE